MHIPEPRSRATPDSLLNSAAPPGAMIKAVDLLELVLRERDKRDPARLQPVGKRLEADASRNLEIGKQLPCDRSSGRYTMALVNTTVVVTFSSESSSSRLPVQTINRNLF